MFIMLLSTLSFKKDSEFTEKNEALCFWEGRRKLNYVSHQQLLIGHRVRHGGLGGRVKWN